MWEALFLICLLWLLGLTLAVILISGKRGHGGSRGKRGPTGTAPTGSSTSYVGFSTNGNPFFISNEGGDDSIILYGSLDVDLNDPFFSLVEAADMSRAATRNGFLSNLQLNYFQSIVSLSTGATGIAQIYISPACETAFVPTPLIATWTPQPGNIQVCFSNTVDQVPVAPGDRFCLALSLRPIDTGAPNFIQGRLAAGLHYTFTDL